ncbi:Rubredoxin [Clostridiaceae bacterium JG1575]|nr:Rubredoxin [Clostridiaceae bacterium JG1575]
MQKPIIIYTSTTCPYCDMAKEYFKAKGIAYEEKSTQEPEHRKKLVSLGIRGVPAIFIGEDYVVGFDQNKIEQLLMAPAASEEAKEPGEVPEGGPKEPEEKSLAPEDLERYVCSVCGYIYDPKEGDVPHGIPQGTPFAALPEDWVCPLCGVNKDSFEKA